MALPGRAWAVGPAPRKEASEALFLRPKGENHFWAAEAAVEVMGNLFSVYLLSPLNPVALLKHAGYTPASQPCGAAAGQPPHPTHFTGVLLLTYAWTHLPEHPGKSSAPLVLALGSCPDVPDALVLSKEVWTSDRFPRVPWAPLSPKCQLSWGFFLGPDLSGSESSGSGPGPPSWTLRSPC